MAKQIIKYRGIFLALFGALLLVGCSVPGTYMTSSNISAPVHINGHLVKPHIIPLTSKVIARQRSYQYRVGSYDILSIIVWNHPELTVPIQSAIRQQININNAAQNAANPEESGILVDKEGKMFFPYAGRVKVANLTLNQVRRVLMRKLAKYIRKPQVSVRVAVYASQTVTVIGEVQKPGSQSITDKPLTLMDAINGAGGIDTVSADTRHIYVIRDAAKGPEIYWSEAQSPQNLLLTERFVLRNNDIVYIAPAGIAGWNRIVSQIMPTVQTVWYTHAMTK